MNEEGTEGFYDTWDLPFFHGKMRFDALEMEFGHQIWALKIVPWGKI